ncbi:MAG: hypothetical protein DME05_25205, partial [Candidatus Rokuibacteriota bacterium]
MHRHRSQVRRADRRRRRARLVAGRDEDRVRRPGRILRARHEDRCRPYCRAGTGFLLRRPALAQIARPDRLTLALFVGVVLIGGSNFVAVRFSNAELPPYWGAALRFLPASMLLLAAMAIWRIPFPRGASLRGAVIYGALNFGLGYALTYYGLQDAPAGTGAVVLATVPLFTLVLVALHGLEPFRARGLVG